MDQSEYLGATITTRPLDSSGAYAAHHFAVEAPDGTGFLLTFRVSYTDAAEVGRVPEAMAQETGLRLVHGLLHTMEWVPGEDRVVSSGDLPSERQISDHDGSTLILEMARRMARAEAHSATVPAMDIPGVALVLGVEVPWIQGLLIEMEIRGLIESDAASFGHSLTDGAFRITAAGIQDLGDSGAQTSTEGEPGTSSTPAARDEEPEEGRIRLGISYSHDSDPHKDRVRGLAAALRKGGVLADLDQFHPAPPEGWPGWMTDLISRSAYVLVVCTPTYLDRVTSEQPPEGGGQGSRFEGLLISQEIFESGGRNDKFIPVVFSEDDLESIPPWLRPYTRYDLSAEGGFQDLYRRLTGQPAVVAPEIGSIVELPPVEPPQASFDGALATPTPLPEWHVDLVVNLHSELGPTRYGVVWQPGVGFRPSNESDEVMLRVPAPPLEELDAVDASIQTFFLPGDRLRFDFANPFTPVSGFVHLPGREPIGPSAKGGGAPHFYEFALGLLEQPADAS